MNPKKSKNFVFESALEDLEKIVAAMEQGNLSLEQSLKHFEKGVTLTRQCQEALKAAENNVKILAANEKLEDFQSERESPSE